LQCDASFDEGLLSRAVHRLIEVGTYRAASMLALTDARGVWPRPNEIDTALAQATGSIGGRLGESRCCSPDVAARVAVHPPCQSTSHAWDGL